MIFKKLFSSALLFSSLIIHAQSPSLLNGGKQKKLLLENCIVQTGLFGEASQNASLVDFQRLAPNSSLLQSNFEEYKKADSRVFNGHSALTVQTGWRLFNPKTQAYRTRPLLKLGLNVMRGTAMNTYLWQNETLRFDTLQSSQNSTTLYRDSVLYSNYSVSYASTQLRMDAAMVWTTSAQKRLQLWAGLGVNAGIALNSIVDVHYSTGGRTEIYDSNGDRFYQQGNTFNSGTLRERFSARNSMGISAYVPLGLSFRLGEKSELLRKIHLVFEMRPGVNATIIRGLNPVINPALQYGMGLKFTL